MNIKIFFLFVIFFGCTDTEENASINLKKGDTFFEKKEYEVAEYYYERIPEESPLFKQASKKLEAIVLIKKQWVEVEVPATEVAKITILDHQYSVNNVTHVPAHAITLYNSTTSTVEYVGFEFIYYDTKGKEIIKLKTEVRTSLYPNSRDTFNDIGPGYVPQSFATSTARVIKARYH